MAKFIKFGFFFSLPKQSSFTCKFIPVRIRPETQLKSEYKRGIILLHEVSQQNNAGINCNITIPQQQLYPLLPTV